jgi:hypothetical protein
VRMSRSSSPFGLSLRALRQAQGERSVGRSSRPATPSPFGLNLSKPSLPFGLRLSKPLRHGPFDELRANGREWFGFGTPSPFGLSLSKPSSPFGLSLSKPSSPFGLSLSKPHTPATGVLK